VSYCRWSTDDFQCDLYCYADVSGGYTTHVAGRRRVYKNPLPPKLDMPEVKEHDEASAMAWTQKWIVRNHEVSRAPHDWLDLPATEDGLDTYNDPDLPSFKARLLDLRRQGFQFPDSVLEEIDAEMQEQPNEEA
jgi:hypothetical protein